MEVRKQMDCNERAPEETWRRRILFPSFCRQHPLLCSRTRPSAHCCYICSRQQRSYSRITLQLRRGSIQRRQQGIEGSREDDEELYERLLYQLNTTGAVLSPFDSYLVMRGLKTLSLRMERATKNAQKIVTFLKKLPSVKEVLYPGLGGMISLKVTDKNKIPAILNHLSVLPLLKA